MISAKRAFFHRAILLLLCASMLLAFQTTKNVIATSRAQYQSSNSNAITKKTHFFATRAHEGHSVEAEFTIPGNIRMRNHKFRVPLDYGDESNSETIELFVREMVREGMDGNKDLPCLVYLQGGPGYPAGRPRGEGGWLARACATHRVFLLDQRGTGRSQPLEARALAQLRPEVAAARLKLYRADSIVRDCEAVRAALTGGKPWTVLAQSFGGFCLLTYLSFFPEGVAQGLFTGGLAPVTRGIDEVYRALAKRQAKRNKLFYERYPHAAPLVRRIVRHLAEHPEGGVALPSGGRLTARRFLQLGLGLGRKTGLEDLYYLVEGAFAADGELTYAFLCAVEAQQSFDTNPIYALLHEPIYCEGAAPRWSAERVIQEDGLKEFFDYKERLKTDDPIYFTGEMVFSWMFDGDYPELAPLKETAELLAADANWGPLYAPDNLRNCSVPCAAAVYYDDLYVERVFSEEVAELMPNCKVWITNEYQHSGIGDDGHRIVDKLMGMAGGNMRIPS